MAVAVWQRGSGHVGHANAAPVHSGSLEECGCGGAVLAGATWRTRLLTFDVSAFRCFGAGAATWERRAR
eukprot:8910677-Alexandrium_andersonii.AAC.1